MQYGVRTHSYIADGPHHFFETIDRSRYLPRKYKAVIHSSIQTNSSFALPENVFRAMMKNRRLSVRQDVLFQLNTILIAREDKTRNLYYSI